MTNDRQSRWRLYKIFLFFFLVTLLVLACGGPGNNTRTRGIYYQVKAGDTLSKIARLYQVNIRKLAEANKISSPDQLAEGAIIFIPDAGQVRDQEMPSASDDVKSDGDRGPATTPPEPERTAVDARTVDPKPKVTEKALPAESKPSGKKEKGKSSPEISSPTVRKKPVSEPLWQKPMPVPEGTIPPPDMPVRPKEFPVTPKETGAAASRPEEAGSLEKGRFSWPVKGKVANRFGLQPNGMYYNHIRIVSRENVPVATAAPGTVIFSAPLKEFGETIIIKHDPRFATVYTHLGARSVKVDQQVKKGDPIGLVGKSEIKNEGYIHFEIRENNKSRNPLLFLP